MPLELTLETQVEKAQTTAVGLDVYLGGPVFERGTRRQVAVFGMLVQTIDNVTTNNHGLNSGMLKLEIFALPNVLLAQPGGGAGGGAGAHVRAPDSITLHGAPMFRGQHAPTVNQVGILDQATGSVSATSAALAQFRDQTFRLTITSNNIHDLIIG